MKDYMEYYNSGGETEAQDNGESNILKDFFGDDEDGNSSGGEQQTPETELPYIDDTPYVSDPYSGGFSLWKQSLRRLSLRLQSLWRPELFSLPGTGDLT